MYNYYIDQLQPIIDIQKKEHDKYKAKIKVFSGGDNLNIQSNYIDVSIEQLKKILDILK